MTDGTLPSPSWPREVPIVGLGTADLGGRKEGPDESRSLEILAAALAHQVALIDTAPWYGLGRSEVLIGRALSQAPSSSVAISTKVGRILLGEPEAVPASPFPNGFAARVVFDYSATGFERSIADSLARLGRPTVDALIVHDLDPGYHETPTLTGHLRDLAASGWPALQARRSEGTVAQLGVGVNRVGMVHRFLDLLQPAPDFFMVAMPYTLLDQSGLAELDRCQREGVDVVIGAPFASGLLADDAPSRATYGYRVPDRVIVERAQSIGETCRSYGIRLSAAALQFVLLHPAVIGVVAGASETSHVSQLIEDVAIDIPEELWSRLCEQGLIVQGAC